MDLLESIFSESDFKIPVEFGSDDFETEVDDLLKAYIRALEDKGVSQWRGQAPGRKHKQFLKYL